MLTNQRPEERIVQPIPYQSVAAVPCIKQARGVQYTYCHNAPLYTCHIEGLNHIVALSPPLIKTHLSSFSRLITNMLRHSIVALSHKTAVFDKYFIPR